MKRELSRKKNIVNIVWFKKDLRSSDHAPLHEAALGEYPILPIYVFEPDYWKQEDAAFRHWEFTKQSLEFLRADLSKLGQALVFRKGKRKEKKLRPMLTYNSELPKTISKLAKFETLHWFKYGLFYSLGYHIWTNFI